MNKAQLETLLRNDILETITAALVEKYDTDVLDVSASELTIPLLDAESNEKFALIKVSIPRGSRVDGTYQPYDGYAAHDEWEQVKAEDAAKKRAREEKKAREEAEKERKRAAKATVKTMKKDIQEALPNATGTTSKNNDE